MKRRARYSATSSRKSLHCRSDKPQGRGRFRANWIRRNRVECSDWPACPSSAAGQAREIERHLFGNTDVCDTVEAGEHQPWAASDECCSMSAIWAARRVGRELPQLDAVSVSHTPIGQSGQALHDVVSIAEDVVSHHGDAAETRDAVDVDASQVAVSESDRVRIRTEKHRPPQTYRACVAALRREVRTYDRSRHSFLRLRARRADDRGCPLL